MELAAEKSPPRLMGQLKVELEKRKCSLKTMKAYGCWVRLFLRHHNYRHPNEMGEAEIRNFLLHLKEQRAAVNTQRQAVMALIFLYKHVIKKDVKGFHKRLTAEISMRSKFSLRKFFWKRRVI